MNIRTKILLPMVGLAVISSLSIALIGILNIRNFSKEAEIKEVTVANATILGYKRDLEANIERGTLMAARNPEVIVGLTEFLENGDRKRLVDAVMYIAQYSDIDFYTIMDMSGRVVIRSHAPDRFGDNNADIPHIKVALGGRQAIAYESTAANPIALRCGIPIIHNNRQIGVASAGFDLTSEAFVDKMKDITGSEITVFLGNTRIATTFRNERGERNVGTPGDERITRQVLAGNPFVGPATVNGIHFYTYYAPINDADGKAFGIIFNGVDITETEKQTNGMIMWMVILVAIFCVVAVVIAIYTA
ncbi:MAG: cache domain-containing protein, partial [Chitinispirillales bacterium]|nr:cache domain-containing protein [Chitinispirillales bacterium]